jgi:small subunit ribosomal protein S21
MNGVYIRNTENLEKALRRFKRVCDSAGVIPELKQRRTFEKPSITKRLKRKDAIRKAQKALAEEERENNRY